MFLCLLVRGCLNQRMRSCPSEIRANVKSAKESGKERRGKDEKRQQGATEEEDKKFCLLQRQHFSEFVTHFLDAASKQIKTEL